MTEARVIGINVIFSSTNIEIQFISNQETNLLMVMIKYHFNRLPNTNLLQNSNSSLSGVNVQKIYNIIIWNRFPLTFLQDLLLTALILAGNS